MKAKAAIIHGTVMLLAIFASGAFADPHDKGEREVRKAQMEYEREQRKRDREWEREALKHYRELEREEHKHLEEMARDERKREEEMWREGGYTLDEPGYDNGVDESYESDYMEDKVYRLIKDIRSLAEIQ